MPTSTGFDIIVGKIKVDGAEDDISYSDLSIHQAVADVNSFEFIWIDYGKKPTLDAYISFYQKYLSNSVTISIGDSFSFKGFITAIKCIQGDELAIQYEIKGKGLIAKLDEVPDCNSFPKKTIKDIFTQLNTAGVPANLAPKNQEQLFYTVQYNQTAFAFFRMLAIRYGEWFFYNGKELVLGQPKRAEVSLQVDHNVDNIMFSAEIQKGSLQTNGFDQRMGELLKKKSPPPPQSPALLIAASMKAGEAAFAGNENGISLPHVTTTQVLTSVSELHQKSKAAAAVYVTGHSYAAQLYAGMRINIKDSSNGDSGDYIITEVTHSLNSNGYSNEFKACPAEVEVPPYTNPMLVPQCKPQPALVTDNVDADGLDRIKVRFPWQKASEKTPWINVLTPHAGKNKGFRFLPEVGEEVMIGFIDDNAEKPFFMGAIHTEKNKSADPEAGNNIKAIGTVSGRRFQIDDDKGQFQIADNRKDAYPLNALLLERKDANVSLQLSSGKSKENYTAVKMKNQEEISVGLFSGGQLMAEVTLASQGQKITIKTKGSIDISADQDINIKGLNVNIQATQKLKMEGKMGVAMSGMKMDLSADAAMGIKGAATTIEGSAKLDLKAGGMASLVAALVKIN